MGQSLRLAVFAAVIAAAGWYGWRWFFPDDEALIRAVLTRIEENVGGNHQDGEVGRLARAASLRAEFDQHITIDAGPPFSTLSGRDAVIGAAARLNTSVPDVELRFVDVQVSMAPDRASANVYMTAEATFREARGGQALEARELDVTFRKADGAWVISNVNLVRTLEPVNPR
jgi:SnoaL-like domain